MCVRFLLPALVAVFPATAFADVKPHPIFTDNMVLQRDAELPVWGKAEAGEKVTVTVGSLTAIVETDRAGNWKAKLPASKAAPKMAFTIEGKNKIEFKNVAVGDVWVCSGQSNMEMKNSESYDLDRVKLGAKNANLRLFTVSKRTSPTPLADQDDLKHFGKWSESAADTIPGFSAAAYHFGQNLQKSLNVPIGLIHTSWGGTPAEAWTSIEALDAVAELKHYAASGKKAAEQFEKDKKAIGPNVPASLYNAMIHPLLPFGIKGAIWYQGESNAGRAYEYRTLFTTMIQDWRTKWGSDFPFYAVMLAPWHAGDADGVSWAELREAQVYATKKLKNVGVAVINDAGDLYDIHPRDKATVGNRLALAARAGTYGQKIAGSGPSYKESKIEGDKVVIQFDNLGGGLMAKYQTLNGFTVCGEDKYFYPAKAVIVGTTIEVSSEKVPKPVAVRFGWKNYPVVNLYNKEGLPAVPFKTDDFPWTTMPKK